MKKITLMTKLAVGFCFLRGVPLWAAENGTASSSYLLDWLFIGFFTLVMVSLLSVRRKDFSHSHTHRRHKKDMLQRYFHKWVAH